MWPHLEQARAVEQTVKFSTGFFCARLNDGLGTLAGTNVINNGDDTVAEFRNQAVEGCRVDIGSSHLPAA